jgi:hypothetical protein
MLFITDNRTPTDPANMLRRQMSGAMSADYAETEPVPDYDDLVRLHGIEYVVVPGSTSSLDAAVEAATQLMRPSLRQDPAETKPIDVVLLENAPTESGVAIIRPAKSAEMSYARTQAAARSAQARADRIKERNDQLDKHVRPMTAGPITVAEAARLVLANRGRIDVTAAGMVVHAPVGIGTSGDMNIAAEVLYAAEAHVVAWDKGKRKNALPDVQVTPNGTLVG